MALTVPFGDTVSAVWGHRGGVTVLFRGTVGDPKLDLGWVVQSWPEDTESPEYSGSGGYADMSGMPSQDRNNEQ